MIRPLAVAALAGALAACGPKPAPTPPANEAPFARFSAPAHIKDGDTALLDASASFDPDGTIVSYRFVFGDGTPSSFSGEPTATHPYHGAGLYPVVLTVEDDKGATAEARHTVEVTTDAPPTCDDANPCPFTQLCEQGLCYNQGPGDACATDADCTGSGTGCYGGACVAPECSVDADCGAGAACRGGLCQPMPAGVDGGTVDGGFLDGGHIDGGVADAGTGDGG